VVDGLKRSASVEAVVSLRYLVELARDDEISTADSVQERQG